MIELPWYALFAGALVFSALGAFGRGFFSKAGSDVYAATKERFLPDREDPKPPDPIMVSPGFDYAPDPVLRERQRLMRKSYEFRWAHESERAEREEEGFSTVMVGPQEVHTIEKPLGGMSIEKVWLAKAPPPAQPD